MAHPQANVIDTYWARRFGCLLSDIQTPGVHVVCQEDVDPNRMAVLEIEFSTLIRANSEHENTLMQWADALAENASRSAMAVREAFADQEWKISASEKVLYLNPAEFRPFPRPEVRHLTLEDSDDLTLMHRGCTLMEQQAGEVNIDHPAIFGAFADDQLVAAASLIDQGQTISDVGVLVHRAYRGQGYGRAVVSSLCQWGMDNGRVVQYWRLCSNTGSVHIADSLGFREYGRYQTLHLSISPFF